jgi:hypothetical protein
MAKTIAKALIDEIGYPIDKGLVENKLIARGLDSDEPYTSEVSISNGFKGALADCLISLATTAPTSFSESDISVSRADPNLLIKRANSYYRAIGEDEQLYGEASVCFGGW